MTSFNAAQYLEEDNKGKIEKGLCSNLIVLDKQLNIRKVVGDFEDFVLTSMSSQNDSTVFINKTQKERKELLSQFMGLKIFDRLWVQASEDIKDVNALLTDFKKAD